MNQNALREAIEAGLRLRGIANASIEILIGDVMDAFRERGLITHPTYNRTYLQDFINRAIRSASESEISQALNEERMQGSIDDRTFIEESNKQALFALHLVCECEMRKVCQIRTIPPMVPGRENTPPRGGFQTIAEARTAISGQEV